MNLIVGLTGGIGSGKSTVAEIFSHLGAAVIDTDLIAHELTGPNGAAMPKITAAFGARVIQSDGSLDRPVMRQLCFSDPDAKRRLENILHPMIREESLARCEQAASAPYILLVVPLLIESGAYLHLISRILVVDCDESEQIARVTKRSGISEDTARAIIATQATRAERLAAADDVIVNNGTREALTGQIEQLHLRYVFIKNDENIKEKT